MVCYRLAESVILCQGLADLSNINLSTQFKSWDYDFPSVIRWRLA